MSLLAERLHRLRWMAVPIAAYLVVTLVLPAANGAALHRDFARHAGWVIAGCAAIVAVALAGGLAAALARRGLHRIANRRACSRVTSAGGPP
jgi:hypothetical protein